ncbi:MAG: tetratricopeptide (TPR) repeat protein, partial [Myxococcota bacterium]
ERAIPLFEAAIAEAERAGDPTLAARARASLGSSLLESGKLDEAEALLVAAKALLKDGGALLRVAGADNDLGDVYRVRGDLSLADAHYADAETTLSAFGARAVQTVQANRALVRLAAGDVSGLDTLVEVTGRLRARGRDGLADLFLTLALPYTLDAPDLSARLAAAERTVEALMPAPYDLRHALETAARGASPPSAALLAELARKAGSSAALG